MPYGNDPANVPSDQVRLLVGDTGATPDLTDEAIAFFLLDEGDNPRRAAARAAEALASHYTKVAAEKRVGPLTIVQSARFTSKAMEFLKLAKSLWNRANIATGPVAPSVNRSEKNAAIQDGDRVRPAFGRRMMPYDNQTDYNNADREDLLSPPSEII